MSTLLEIPTSDSNPNYTQTVSLDGSLYQLGLRYNARMQRWILSVNNPNGQAVVSGLPMLALRDLVGQYTTLQVPPGLLFCANPSAPFTDPGLASFLTDTAFFYRTAT